MANEDKRKGFPFVKSVKGESILLANLNSASIKTKNEPTLAALRNSSNSKSQKSCSLYFFVSSNSTHKTEYDNVKF